MHVYESGGELWRRATFCRWSLAGGVCHQSQEKSELYHRHFVVLVFFEPLKTENRSCSQYFLMHRLLRCASRAAVTPGTYSARDLTHDLTHDLNQVKSS